MTYTKPTITVAVSTLMNETILSDAAAIRAFNNKETIKGNGGNVDVYVPYHSVKALIKSVATESVTKEDAYCEE